MSKMPLLQVARSARAKPGEGLTFAVYAPFGTDETLSQYPNKVPASIHSQAVVRALQKVAKLGVNVSALVDLFEDDSWLVEIPAHKPDAMTICSAWKQDMSAPQALAGFLRRAYARFPCSSLVLAIEGHGGGFVPEIDYARITPSSVSNWSQGGQSGQVRWVESETGTSFEPDGGSPPLPMGSPMLPMGSPMLPSTRLPMSTWALGEALRSARRAGVPKPAVIHFNNCFNASVELLHTVAPHAETAAAYANYDFFTAGQAYPKVFAALKTAGGATALQLAQWFAGTNGALLAAKRNHPSVGAALALSRMKPVAGAIDRFARALTVSLQPADPSDRPPALARITDAAVAAQHYDTEPSFELAAPDQLTDLGAFAAQVGARFPAGPVAAAAASLQAALAGMKQYGDFDRPWMDENQIYDFRANDLALNILFPDPARQGLWDWRSPYYLSGKVDPNAPPAHRSVIPFLAERRGQQPPWVAFIVEYHRDTPFIGFLPARSPFFPIFDARFKPTLPHPDVGNEPNATP
jgi:hypothetical protein